MKGDIAHRSIRSSMSRMVEARLPRMISSVTGSTVAAGRAPAGALRVGGVVRVLAGFLALGMGALQEDVVGVIDPGEEARCDEHGRVVLIDDCGTGERHARGEPGAEICRHGGGAAAAEVHAALAGYRGPRVGGRGRGG